MVLIQYFLSWINSYLIQILKSAADTMSAAH